MAAEDDQPGAPPRSRPRDGRGRARSTRPSAAKTRMPRRCGYSAATRPRLSHMPRSAASRSAADSSGSAAARLLPGAPRHAEPRPDPPRQRSRRKPRRHRAAAPHRGEEQRGAAASARSAQDTAVGGGSGASRASVVSIARSGAARRTTDPRRRLVLPADLDRQHLDPGAPERRQPRPILGGGHQPGAGGFRLAPQSETARLRHKRW